jgi:hypothetical protein
VPFVKSDVAIDTVPARLALARRFGADIALSRDELGLEACVAATRELGRRGGADVVIETAGVPGALADGLQLVRLDVLLEAQEAAVAAVEGAREGSHVGGLDLLASADQAVAGDPEDERARDGQGGPEPGVGGGQGRAARRVAGGVGGQIPPCRHQGRHQLQQRGRRAGCLHVSGSRRPYAP